MTQLTIPKRDRCFKRSSFFYYYDGRAYSVLGVIEVVLVKTLRLNTSSSKSPIITHTSSRSPQFRSHDRMSVSPGVTRIRYPSKEQGMYHADKSRNYLAFSSVAVKVSCEPARGALCGLCQ